MLTPRTLTLAAALVVALSAPAGAAPAGGDPLRCGDTVTGHATLAADLTCTAGPGVVLTSGSTLDLGGHTLTGPGAERARAAGVVLHGEPSRETTIRNGTLTGWGAAVAPDPDEYPTAVARVHQVTFRDNGAGLTAGPTGSRYDVTSSRFAGNGTGIEASWGTRSTIADSTFTGNDYGIDSFGGGLLQVVGSTFVGNRVGVSCSEQSMDLRGSTFVRNDLAAAGWWCMAAEVTDSRFQENGTGWSSTSYIGSPGQVPPDEVRGNRFMGNDVAVRASESTNLVSNVFTDNRSAMVGDAPGPDEMFPEEYALIGNVFTGNGDAVTIPHAQASLRANRALRNEGWGIYAPHAIDLGGNVAGRNGTEPQCVGVVCAAR